MTCHGTWPWRTTHDTAVRQEKLGFKVELKGPGGVAVDGFFALTGCVFPTNSVDRGCNASTTYIHINVEVWTSTYSGDWDQIQERFAEMAPRQLGNMGYYGATAMYIPLTVLEQGYDSEGINLDFYREYNVSKKNPGKFFAAPSDLNVARLRPCNETALMLNEAGGRFGLKNPKSLSGSYTRFKHGVAIPCAQSLILTFITQPVFRIVRRGLVTQYGIDIFPLHRFKTSYGQSCLKMKDSLCNHVAHWFHDVFVACAGPFPHSWVTLLAIWDGQ